MCPAHCERGEPGEPDSLSIYEQRDCLNTMRQQEMHIRSFDSDPYHIQHRPALIEYVFEITDEFGLSATTAHMSVKYMDIMLACADKGRKIPSDRWQLVVMVSLWIAAKLHEVKAPTLTDLYEAAGQFYHPLLIKAFEIEVLEALEWRLNVVVPLQFLELWDQNGLVFEQDRLGKKPLNSAKAANLTKCLRYFACVGVQDYQSEAFLPSHVAAGMIAASRAALRIEPVWNKDLTEITGFAPVEVFPHYQRLWAVHQQRTRDLTPSIGFEEFSRADKCLSSPLVDTQLINSLAQELRSKLRVVMASPTKERVRRPRRPSVMCQ
eukprot:gb/GEZN01007699.1/.p1 GENE.gb/GEZN01007699.1/~~gb/GEZN01007699.1/.p1  ORF type:complete len:322 (-),score=37.21 gb/GEZN01007699.1/:515-1480(-)